MSFLAELEEYYNVEYSPIQHNIMNKIEDDFMTESDIHLSAVHSHHYFSDVKILKLGFKLETNDFTFELILHEMMHFIFASNKQRTSNNWSYLNSKRKHKDDNQFIKKVAPLEAKIMAYVWTLMNHYEIDEFDSLNNYIHNMANGLSHSLQSYLNQRDFPELYEILYSYIEEECLQKYSFEEILKEWQKSIYEFKSFINETK